MSQLEEQKYLHAKERQEFRDLEALFDSPGWKRLIEVMQEEIDIGPTYWFANAQDWEQLVAARARTRVLQELINYDMLTENRKANLIESRRQQADDALEEASLEGL